MGNKNHVLIVAAHPDDELLGVGGVALKHLDEGSQVSVLILGDGELSRDEVAEGAVLRRADLARTVGKKLGFTNVFLETFADNQFDTVPLLSLVKSIERHIVLVQPEVVYTHHGGDINIDHQRTYDAVLTACRPLPGFVVKKICTFETVSSTEWGSRRADVPFIPNEYHDISKYIDRKIDALRIYEEELRAYPHPRSPEGVRILAQYRGMEVGYSSAEAFRVIRNLRD